MVRARLGICSLLLGVLLAGVARAEEPPTFAEAERRWKRHAKRPPLQLRWRAMYDLAWTQEPAAFELLARRYGRPRAPKDHERYLIASLCGEYFNEPDDLPRLQALARKHVKDRDAWLWFHVLETARRVEATAWVEEVAADTRRNRFVRAAALESMARAADSRALEVLREQLDGETWRKPFDRSLLLESGASILLAWKVVAAEEPYQQTALRLLERLREKDVGDRTRLVVARRLGRAFDVDRLSLDPAYWEQVVRNQKEIARGSDTLARPRFGGLEATGRRIAYLIDMSDSMAQPLDPGALPDLEVGVDILDDDRARTIGNRFDLARELLRASVTRLPKGTEFLVVVFGSEARCLEATPGLTPATPRAVEKAMAEIEAVVPGNDEWKATNMHGAFLRAFQATSGRPLKEDEHVLEKGFARGCDTVFLLSDGEPTFGEFGAWDVADPGTRVGDAEHGDASAIDEERKIFFWCPYRWGVTMLRDLRRLNLFRKVEIHCLGTGEADEKLLEQIAEIGLGRVRILGK